MSLIPVSELMASAKSAKAKEVKGRNETAHRKRPFAAPSKDAPSRLVKANGKDASDARLYLVAMTHFFSGFSGDEGLNTKRKKRPIFRI